MWLFNRRKKRHVERNPKKVLLLQVFVGVCLVVFFTLLILGVWHGTRIASLTITEVEVTGGETISHDEIRSRVEAELNGTYYKLVPKRFAWTYPEEFLKQDILAIERVKNVELKRTSGTKLVIVFEEYQPFALWCENLEATDCLFLNRNGFAFGHAPKLEGGAFLRFSKTNSPPELNATPFEKEFVRQTQTFIDRVYNGLSLNIIQVEQTAEDELTYHISGGGQLKVSTRMSNDETFENLSTILASEEFAHIAPGNFQYIDLRYGNKIFINEEPEKKEEPPESATPDIPEG